MNTERGPSVVESCGRTAILGDGDREAVLVCANEPLRSELSDFVRARGYVPRVSVTPLQAIAALLEAGNRIRHALIAADLPQDWGRGLHEFLADEYPDICRVTLGASC